MDAIIKRSRLYARKSNLKSVQDYVKSVNHDILLLIAFLHDPAKFEKNEKLLFPFLPGRQKLTAIIKQIGIHDLVLNKLHREEIKSAGKVLAKDVCAVLTDGNIRERMTLIMNFGYNACDLIWKLINIHVTKSHPLPAFISKSNLVKRIERIGRIIIIIIIEGHSLRRACLQPATNTQNLPRFYEK